VHTNNYNDGFVGIITHNFYIKIMEQQYDKQTLHKLIVQKLKQIGADDGDGNRVYTLANNDVVYANAAAIILRKSTSNMTVSKLTNAQLLTIAKEIGAV
jgi:hypothetical protein